MKYLLIFFFSINALNIFSQSTVLADTTYYDINKESTTIMEDAVYARVTKRDGNKTLIGMTRDYYLPSWTKLFEGKLLSQNPDVYDGICSFYYQNGNLSLKAKYVKKIPVEFDQWNEEGKKVLCKDTIQEAAPYTEIKLGSSLLSNSTSRTVYTMNIGFQYKKLFIRYQIFDEGTNPEFIMASSLLSAYYTGGVSMLKNLLAVKESKENEILTKNTIFFTHDRSVAAAFISKKPYDESKIFNKQINMSNKTFELEHPTKITYICIQNDNYKTDAKVRINAFGTVNYCGN